MNVVDTQRWLQAERHTLTTLRERLQRGADDHDLGVATAVLELAASSVNVAIDAVDVALFCIDEQIEVIDDVPEGCTGTEFIRLNRTGPVTDCDDGGEGGACPVHGRPLTTFSVTVTGPDGERLPAVEKALIESRRRRRTS